MTLPELTTTKDNVTMVSSFLGLNKHQRIQDSEFAEMHNLSNDDYPILTARKKKVRVQNGLKMLGVVGGDDLSYAAMNYGTYDQKDTITCTSTEYVYTKPTFQDTKKITGELSLEGKYKYAVAYYKDGSTATQWIRSVSEKVGYESAAEDTNSVADYTFEANTTSTITICKDFSKSEEPEPITIDTNGNLVSIDCSRAFLVKDTLTSKGITITSSVVEYIDGTTGEIDPYLTEFDFSSLPIKTWTIAYTNTSSSSYTVSFVGYYTIILNNTTKSGIRPFENAENINKIVIYSTVSGYTLNVYYTISYSDETYWLYVNETKVCPLDSQYEDQERKLIHMGAYIVVFPDGIVYNEYENSYSTIANKTIVEGVKMQMCKLDGTEMTSENTSIGKTEPDTSTYTYWLDTSSDPAILKMYSSNYSMWTSVGTTYVKISATGIGKGFNKYDAVRLSGITTKGYNDFDFNYDKDSGNTMLIYDCGDDYITVAALIDLYHEQATAVTVERYCPSLDFIAEMDNRIWGCNSDNHEIYACKQGSPWNWECYAGLDSDSYAATVGSQGIFTGMVAYGGYMFFFKEDGFHKLYGTKPSNYEMIWKPCRGVMQGCDKSIAVVNEVLFYKSRDAIVSYDGSFDTVSDKIDTTSYYEAVAAGYRNKYYICMRDSDLNYYLYIYDTTKGTWVVEEDIRYKFMAYSHNALYLFSFYDEMFCTNKETIRIKYFPGQGTEQYLYPFPSNGFSIYNALFPGDYKGTAKGVEEDDFEWSFVTADMGLENPYSQYLKRINMRFKLNSGTYLKIEIQYDSDGEWQYVTDYTARAKKSYEIPIPVRRADHLKLRVSGSGEFELYSIAKCVEQGSGVTNGEN